MAGLLFIWTLRRLWQQATPSLPSDTKPVQAAAIKGPLAFTEQDGKLFRRLGREVELTQLVGLLDDDQTGLAVVMGESGAGKTSLLRAGLSNLAADRDLGRVYWEALHGDPATGLLRAVQSRWQAARYPAPPQSLDDLQIPPLGTGRRVVVLDQFEQLHPEQDAHRPIFELLRHIAGELPPHRTTWLVAFRREYAATWLEFLEPRTIQPPILFVNRFQPAQAGVVIATLAEEADIQLKQDLADAMVRDMATAGRVSPVDIGIGMMMLDELARGQNNRHLTRDDYLGAGGGAEGLLAGYIAGRLEWFPESRRDPLLKAMLTLMDPDTEQRIAEGRTLADLSTAAGLSQEALASRWTIWPLPTIGYWRNSPLQQRRRSATDCPTNAWSRSCADSQGPSWPQWSRRGWRWRMATGPGATTTRSRVICWRERSCARWSVTPGISTGAAMSRRSDASCGCPAAAGADATVAWRPPAWSCF